MGALSPRTRNAQVALYQSGDVDFMVATDAIGMGLNMDIDHVAFAATEKFDGTMRRPLRASELAQIAGRAGRHMNDGTFGVTAEAEALDGETIEAVENHRFDPVRVIQWRNANLDYSSIAALDHSLDVLPPTRGLTRARAAVDQLVLRILGAEANITALTQGPAGVKQLWQVCQIPDFRKIAVDEHARLVGNIFEHLMSHEGVLPEDWINGHVARLDNVEGDIDAIAQRIAHIRTWTYVANRPNWLTDSAGWQEKTRAIEDHLSDALHEKLTQRFVDRRTSVLMRRLREDEEFAATVDSEGEVLVEGEYVGRLQGFSFVPDPRAVGIHGRALRAAALKGLAGEIAARAHALTNAPEAAITLSEHGRLWWNGGIVAKLKKGHDPLAPHFELLADDLLAVSARERASKRLDEWLARHIAKILAPLLAVQAELKKELPAKTEPATPPSPVAEPAIEAAESPESVENSDEGESEAPDTVGVAEDTPAGAEPAPAADVTLFASPLQGSSRGLAFQIYENLGSVSRQAATRELRAISQSDRGPLRRLGVRFGAFSIFMPALVKPSAARLKALLWAVHQGMSDVPPPPGAGLTSLPADPNVAAGFYEAAGFRLCGVRAVRLDMLERLGEIIRNKGKNGQMPDAFAVSPDMMSVLGCGEEDLAQVLRGLGFREAKVKNEGEAETTQWQQRARREERRPKAPPRKPEAVRTYRRPVSEVAAAPYGQPATEPRVSDSSAETARVAPKGRRPDHKPRPKDLKSRRDDDRPRRDDERERVKPRRPDKPLVVDPDSPFAALAALKFQK
jgi:ATP-dependent RNA helicase SUPV3L1/SUV3